MLSIVVFVFAVTNKQAYCDHQRSYCSIGAVFLVGLLLHYVSVQNPMPTFGVVQSLTNIIYGAFLRQVKDMKMLLDDGKNSLLALAMAGKSAAVFNSVKGCLDQDLTSQEV